MGRSERDRGSGENNCMSNDEQQDRVVTNECSQAAEVNTSIHMAPNVSHMASNVSHMAPQPIDPVSIQHGLASECIESNNPLESGSSAIDVDGLMKIAYGKPLLRSDGVHQNDYWHARWKRVVHLSSKQYHLLGGSVGRRYVDLLVDEVHHLADGSEPSERVIVFCSVMLQRDKMVKKGSDVRRLLNRRMSLWKDEKFDILIQEAERCDRALPKVTKHTNEKEHIVKVFTRLMLLGKVKAAVRWVTNRVKGEVLKPSDVIAGNEDRNGLTVMDVLRSKHPNSCVPTKNTLIKCDNLPYLEELEITSNHVEIVARKIQGGAGPGGCDALHWQDVLLRYGAHSERLREAVAALSRRLANTVTPWNDIKALVSNRLIALNKCPGVRPIGIGETLRRVVGKVVCYVTRDDVEIVCGADQLCAGVKAGIEGAVHATNDLFESYSNDVDGWGVLLVDASNAFNSINRIALLWNARVLWPRCSRYLFNTYRGWAMMVVQGSQELLVSKEGVTQGDPLSMLMYAVATYPLICSLKNPDKWIQNWYADDASAAGELTNLRLWFSLLMERGPAYGYYPEPSKSCLVVGKTLKCYAEKLFVDSGIKVVTDRHLLGGFIGSKLGKDDYVRTKVQKWKDDVESLSMIAVSQPQAAYAALTKSLQFEWSYLQRVVSDCEHLFEDLEEVLETKFLPAMIGGDVSSSERDLFSLPARDGGLGVSKPTQTARDAYTTSRQATSSLVKAIKGECSFDPDMHEDSIYRAREEHKMRVKEKNEKTFSDTIIKFDHHQQRAL